MNLKSRKLLEINATVLMFMGRIAAGWLPPNYGTTPEPAKKVKLEMHADEI